MDDHPKQEIAKNSSGIQAQGSIAIDNSGIKGDALLPVLINLGGDISAVKAMVSEIREHQRSENFRIHMKNIQARIHRAGQFDMPTSDQHLRTSKETELVEKWMDEVSNIDPEEKVLSEIWRKWMLNLAAGQDSNELGLMLEIMKKLTPAHGKLLLDIKNNKGFYKSLKSSSLRFAYLKELENQGAVTIRRRVSGFVVALLISIVLIIVMFVMFFNFSSNNFPISIGVFLSVFISLVIVFFLSMLLSREFYSKMLVTDSELTEIGERIVSFAST